MKRFIILLFISSLFYRCDYLDVVPVNDIETVETIFEKREQAERWLKSCYVLFGEGVGSVIDDPAYMGADELVSGEYLRSGTYAYGMAYDWPGAKIADGLQMSQEPYGNLWLKDGFYAGIRYCNIFFENIGKTYGMEQSEKDLWTAELKALKAHFYFELLRRYGPVILVPENIDANAEIEAMQQPRRPVDTCVNEIVRLLDEAMEDLPPLAAKAQIRWAYHSLESAAALKALTLLYAASPLFNGNPNYANFRNKQGEQLFSTEYDKEKWRIAAEAADEAIQLCIDGGKKLVTGNFTGGSTLRNVMLDIENSVLASNFVNDEAIFMIRPLYGNSYTFWFPYILPFYPGGDPDYYTNWKGCISPSMKMVEMYYTENGLPIDQDKEWDYTARYQLSGETNSEYRNVIPLNTKDVLGLHLRREPRFYANIASDRTYWIRTGFSANDEESIVKTYKGERYGCQQDRISVDYPQNLSGYYLKKSLYSGLSNMEYSSFESGREEAFVMIRLAELYLASAEAWNEYLDAPDERVYYPLDEIRKRAGIPEVRDAWQNYGKDPSKATTKSGMREIIRQEWNIEFAFEGRRFWNLRRWLTAAEELNTPLYGWNILGETAQEFYNNFEGPVPVWTKREFVAPRDYLFPIRSEEILISSCEQNPGW